MSISRRTFLRSSAVTAAATTAVVTGGIRLGVDDPAFAQDAPVGTDSVAVYLVVVDGLLPEEVAQMPSLRQLATDGFYLPESRAQMLAETTPNHVSMITGMRSDRHGMPGNAVAYLDENIGREPRYLQADTIYSLIARQVPDLVTAAATSKSYIVDMSKHERVDPGREDADATNSPFIVPGLDNAVDAEVGPNALQFSRELDPDFLWMSLGDVDRVGHLDQTGSAQDPTGLPPAVRTSDLQAADRQVGNLIAQLQLDGRWERTVVIFTTDHSMDWSMPDSTVNLFPSFEADPMLAGQIDVGQNGGAALYWLLAPDAPEAPERLRRMREIAIADEGVLEAHYTRPNPMDGGDRVGDLVVITKDGFRMSEPGGFSNPIPGNHGHVETLPIPVIIGGGWDGVVGNDVVPGLPVPGLEGVDRTIPKDVRDPGQAENIDIAPTIAWLLGINPPPGGFDGRVLEEAFSRRPQTRLPVADVPSVPLHDRVEGADRLGTAVALSALAFPDPETVDALVLAAAGDFPDALAATPLASALGGPLLLTPSDALAPQVAAEITRLAPSRVVLVGGPSAISEAVEQAVGGLVDEVQRIGGTSRYDTAALIARALTTAGEEGSPLPAPPGDEEQEGDAAELSQVDVILASGENFPDALVAGPLASLSGRVILLTRPDELPEETMAVIDAIDPARVLIAGGPQAVGTAIESRLRADRTVERLGGDSRFDTAALLVERTIREGGLTDRAFVVDGGNFPDALAAGVAVAQLGGMLLPVAGGGLRASGAIADLLDRRTDGLVRVTVVGGPSAVSAALADEIQDRVAEVRSRRGVALPA